MVYANEKLQLIFLCHDTWDSSGYGESTPRCIGEFTPPVPMSLSWQMVHTLSASSGIGSLLELRWSINATSRLIILVALGLKSLMERQVRTCVPISRNQIQKTDDNNSYRNRKLIFFKNSLNNNRLFIPLLDQEGSLHHLSNKFTITLIRN